MRLGDRHWKAWVGPPEEYGNIGAYQFDFLRRKGLEREHTLLDIGCGSLRLGCILIGWLECGNYYGVEPETDILMDGIKEHFPFVDGKSLAEAGNFSSRADFEYNDLKNASMDFIVAFSIFTHATPKEVQACLRTVRRLLKPEGRFFATHVDWGWDYDGAKGWVAPDCISYKKETLHMWAKEAGLVSRLEENAPNGQEWMEFRREEK